MRTKSPERSEPRPVKRKTTWFSADHHFGHENIIKYCDRPFDTVEEMDAVMIGRWNDLVSKQDTVYYLGDFTLSGYQKFIWYINQLNGVFRIIPGGHDKRWLNTFYSRPEISMKFEILPPIYHLSIGKKNNHPVTLTLCHYPLLSWEKSHYGNPHLHGHCHGTIGAMGSSGDIQMPPNQERGGRMDVGVDCLDFEPISLQEIKNEFGIRE